MEEDNIVEVICEACDGSGYCAGYNGLSTRTCGACRGEGFFEEDA